MVEIKMPFDPRKFDFSRFVPRALARPSFSLARLGVSKLKARNVGRVFAVVAVALAAGHLVQTMAAPPAAAPQQAAGTLPKPAAVVQLAATTDEAPVAPVPAPLPPVALSLAAPPPAPPAAVPSVAVPSVAVPSVAAAFVVVPSVAAPSVAAPSVAAPSVAASDPCAVTLDLAADPGAMIGLTLLAPCAPSARIVLRHAGLAVTAQTTTSGSLFLALPALETDANVEVMFPGGKTVGAAVRVADLGAARRFVVQWQADDAFQLFGHEPDRVVSAANPGFPPYASLPATGGFLTRLGDPSAALPLFAEVYTLPANGTADVVVEAAVTAATCGRELIAETLSSVAGSVIRTDLTVAMPDCSAVGDFLVLNNLAPDLTLAAAN